MSQSRKSAQHGREAQIQTRSYRGPDRRDPDQTDATPEVTCGVKFNNNGDPVLDVRTNVSRRRVGDDTVDLLKCLKAGELDVEIDD